MKTKISQTKIEKICENAVGDSEYAWWFHERVYNAIETIIELINNQLFEKDQIMLVPDEKYLKCSCEFKKKWNSEKGYDIFEHTVYCVEHVWNVLL
jgi:hypothetical protein